MMCYKVFVYIHHFALCRRDMTSGFTELLSKILRRKTPRESHLDDPRLDTTFEVLAEPNLLRGLISAISEKINVKVNTLRDWRTKLLENKYWRPSRENYGCHLRKLSDQLEDSIMAYIESNFLDKGYAICDADVKTIALKFYEESSENEKNVNRGPFEASSSWIQKFKNKYGYVLRKAHLKRRTLNVSAEKKERFKNKVITAIRDVDKRCIINCDQTNWKLINFSGLTWAKRGAEEVTVNIEGDSKKSFTAMATVDAQNRRYPLYLIAKGKTEQCHQQLESVADRAYIDHSKTGWFNKPVMLNYLEWLRREFEERNPDIAKSEVVLILDLYAAHRDKEVRQKAAELGFKLIFIPPSCTDELQPLDVGVFGPLKNAAKKTWRLKYIVDPSHTWTTNDAAQILVECWESLSDDVFKEAWSQYSDFVGPMPELILMSPDPDSPSRIRRISRRAAYRQALIAPEPSAEQSEPDCEPPIYDDCNGTSEEESDDSVYFDTSDFDDEEDDDGERPWEDNEEEDISQSESDYDYLPFPCTGLRSQGQGCYAAAALQVLFHLIGIEKLFPSGKLHEFFEAMENNKIVSVHDICMEFGFNDLVQTCILEFFNAILVDVYPHFSFNPEADSYASCVLVDKSHASITEAVFETIRSIGPRENLQHHILVYSNGSELQPEEEMLLQNPDPRIFPPNEHLENVHSSEGDEALAPKEEERADGSDRNGEEEEDNDDDETNLGETADVAIYKLASCIEFMGIDNNGRFVAYIVRSRWTQTAPGF